MKDLRFYYAFLLKVKNDIPFYDIEDDLLYLIKCLAEKGIVKKMALVPIGDVVNIIVIGGSPALWRKHGAEVKEIDSVVADQIIDMIDSDNLSYIFKVED